MFYSGLKKKIKRYLLKKQSPLINNKLGLQGTLVICDKSSEIDCGFDCYGENNSIVVAGGGSIVKDCYFFIKGRNNKIHIGEHCYIRGTTFWIEDDNNEILVGNGTNITDSNNLTVMEGHSIKIGEDCLLASDINFQAGDGHSIYSENGERENFTEDIVIENHVWIGKRATVMKGVRIAENSVVATGAIVTKKICDSNVVLAGIPAKIVKRNINWGKDRNAKNQCYRSGV